MALVTHLDHIVIGCNSLAEGRAWCRDTLGVDAAGGGQHAGIGTHNTLLSLGPDHYLEIIAIDPEGDAPAFPRWFGLDTDEVKSVIAHGPRLIGWVARMAREGGAHDAIDRIADVPGNTANVVRPAARGDFRWRFAFTETGTRPRGGVLPYFIQWDVPIHPCERLPDVGVRLSSLVLGDPEPDTVSALLNTVGFSDTRVHLGQSASAQLVATLSAGDRQVILE